MCIYYSEDSSMIYAQSFSSSPYMMPPNQVLICAAYPDRWLSKSISTSPLRMAFTGVMKYYFVSLGDLHIVHW